MLRNLVFAFLLLPSVAQAQSSDAAARIPAIESAATGLNTDGRDAALRKILLLISEDKSTDLLATLLRSEVAIEAGPAQIVQALDHLAKASETADRNTLAAVSVPLFRAVADLRAGTVLSGRAAIALDDAIKRLEQAIAAAGLPAISDLVAAAKGDPTLPARIEEATAGIAADAEAARASENLDQLDQKMADETVDRMVDLAAGRLRPIPTAVPYAVFREKLEWDRQMWAETTAGMNVVADAIETGRLDRTAYNRVTERLHVLSKRPWQGENAKKVLIKLCRTASGIGRGDWCESAFDARSREVLTTGANGGRCLVFYRSLVGPALAQSDFQAGADGWTVIENNNATPIAEGGHLSAQDNKGFATYFWSAPAKFLGDQSAAIGGSLSFDLRIYQKTNTSTANLVVLEGGGLKLGLAKGYARPSIAWKRYNIRFQECAGWKNLETDQVATSAELLQVLSALDGIYIRGEYSSDGDDKASLDDVVLWSGR